MTAGTGGIPEWNFELEDPQEGDLTWWEVQAHGQPIEQLRVGDWFAYIGPKNKDGCGGMAMWTGQLVDKLVGCVLVQIDRSWDNRTYWARESKVVRLPHPNEGKRVKLTEFSDE